MDLKTEVVKLFFACTLVPLSVSTGKEEVIILIVSRGVGGLSINEHKRSKLESIPHV